MKPTVLVECVTPHGKTVWVRTTFGGVSQRRHNKKLAKAGLTRVAAYGYEPKHYDASLYRGRV